MCFVFDCVLTECIMIVPQVKKTTQLLMAVIYKKLTTQKSLNEWIERLFVKRVFVTRGRSPTQLYF